MEGQSRRLPSFLLPSPATVTSFSVLYAHFMQQRWSAHIQPSGDRAKSVCKANGDHGVQFSSVPQSCPTLCDPMNHSTPGFPVHHQLQVFTQTHVHQIGDAIQPSHPLSSPSLPAPKSCPALGSFPMSQLFAWGGQSTGVSASASVLQWTPRTDLI